MGLIVMISEVSIYLLLIETNQINADLQFRSIF